MSEFKYEFENPIKLNHKSLLIGFLGNCLLWRNTYLHVVLEDWNLDNENIKSSIKDITAKPYTSGSLLELAWLEAMLSADDAERETGVALAHNYINPDKLLAKA